MSLACPTIVPSELSETEERQRKSLFLGRCTVAASRPSIRRLLAQDLGRGHEAIEPERDVSQYASQSIEVAWLAFPQCPTLTSILREGGKVPG